MLVLKFDDVFVHRLDFIRVLSQPNDSGSAAIQQDKIPNLVSCHLRGPTLEDAVRANALSLCFFDQNRLIAHSLSVQHRNCFRNLAVVFDFNVAKGGRDACNEISDNPYGSRLDPTRLDPLL
jgi:hypothetical protein